MAAFLFILNGLEEQPDGSFTATFVLTSGPTSSVGTAIGNVKPFAGGQAPFTMHVIGLPGGSFTSYTGNVSQQDGVISGTIADANLTNPVSWTLTPAS
jgi:hypothetical protein